MNNDQLAILRLVADAADQYIGRGESVEQPTEGDKKRSAPASRQAVNRESGAQYEALQKAVERYRQAFNIH